MHADHHIKKHHSCSSELPGRKTFIVGLCTIAMAEGMRELRMIMKVVIVYVILEINMSS